MNISIWIAVGSFSIKEVTTINLIKLTVIWLATCNGEREYRKAIVSRSEFFRKKAILVIKMLQETVMGGWGVGETSEIARTVWGIEFQWTLSWRQIFCECEINKWRQPASPVRLSDNFLLRNSSVIHIWPGYFIGSRWSRWWRSILLSERTTLRRWRWLARQVRKLFIPHRSG